MEAAVPSWQQMVPRSPTVCGEVEIDTDPDRSREMMMRIPDVKIVPIDAYHWPLTSGQWKFGRRSNRGVRG